jgi:hypothetical protein
MSNYLRIASPQAKASPQNTKGRILVLRRSLGTPLGLKSMTWKQRRPGLANRLPSLLKR